MLMFGGYLLRFHFASDWLRDNKHSRSFLWCSLFYAGFSVEAGNRRIPPAVKTKVAACAGNEICLCVPIFLMKYKRYSRSILEFSAYLSNVL